MITAKTESGFSIELEDDALEDQELFDAISGMQAGNVFRMSHLTERLLGTEGRKGGLKLFRAVVALHVGIAVRGQAVQVCQHRGHRPGVVAQAPQDLRQAVGGVGLQLDVQRHGLAAGLHHAAAVLRQAGSKGSRQTQRQAAPVQHMVILREIADERVLVRRDQFGEDAEFFPAEKLGSSSFRACATVWGGTRPLSLRRWS